MAEVSEVRTLDPRVFEALLRVTRSQRDLYRRFQELHVTSGCAREDEFEAVLDRVTVAMESLAECVVAEAEDQRDAYRYACELDRVLTPRGWTRQYEGVEGELPVLVSYVWGEHPGGDARWSPTSASVLWGEGDACGVLVTMAAYEGAPLWHHTLEQPSDIAPLLDQLERYEAPVLPVEVPEGFTPSFEGERVTYRSSGTPPRPDRLHSEMGFSRTH